ncbi:MAG: TRAP transporter small permease [Paracoccaceae bacterium]|jgi:TRAP-type C4-dicarboxylate transport system permease small subunit|nr:TRAP transporter small permease [Paracoccaceae bacterium]MDP7186760.1 TRAP transporter small permease [Paracoccaceae bacterium]
MHRTFLNLSRLMAIIGGIVLSLLILLVCLSIVGRTLNGIFHSDLMQGALPGFSEMMLATGIGPINGDFELVEAGIAFAIFMFIPLTQITSGHAVVDVFTNWLPMRGQKMLMAIAEVLFAIALTVIAVQLYEGMLSKQRSGTTTFLLQFPIWWAYALSLIGAVSAAIVGTYVALVRVYQIITGAKILGEEGAEH